MGCLCCGCGGRRVDLWLSLCELYPFCLLQVHRIARKEIVKQLLQKINTSASGYAMHYISETFSVCIRLAEGLLGLLHLRIRTVAKVDALIRHLHSIQ